MKNILTIIIKIFLEHISNWILFYHVTIFEVLNNETCYLNPHFKNIYIYLYLIHIYIYMYYMKFESHLFFILSKNDEMYLKWVHNISEVLKISLRSCHVHKRANSSFVCNCLCIKPPQRFRIWHEAYRNVTAENSIAY